MISPMPEDQYIKVGNLKTRYWTLGDKGTSVILIHGLAASADIWMYNVKALAEQHRVYVPDLVGFGRSDKPGSSFSAFDYTPFLDGFINTMNIDRGSLVGQSMGGGIALRYALQFPQKVNKLVLVDSAGLGKEVTRALRLMSVPLVGELFSYSVRSRIAVELAFKFSVRNSALITNDLVDFYYDISSQPGFWECFLRILRQFINIDGQREEIVDPIMNNLYRIIQPVLIIWGKEDQILPIKHGHLSKEKLPNAELKIMDGCGHIPFFERSDEFNRLVLKFLAE